MGICNHIFFQDLSASLCLSLSVSSFAINNNFIEDRTKLYMLYRVGCRNKLKTTYSLKKIKQNSVVYLTFFLG